jgi:ADP-ribosylglycohydrolase
MITLTQADYRDRVLGGWMGKLIGAAVGASSNGQKQPPAATDLSQALSQRRSPANEGTDLQVVWLRALQSAGPDVTTEDLAGGWLRHVAHTHGEYPYARANLRRDIPPPMSGAFDNPFREALGGLARAEIWGMLTPGDPEQAAWFARRDAMLDHAAAGVEAAIWLAGMASAAFVEGEIGRVVEVALGLVPEEGRIARAVRDVIRWHGEYADWERTREMLLRSYSSDDLRDSVVAAGFIALALLHGRGDFNRSVLTAANCGWSATCTCAAVAALLGLAAGARGLPDEWKHAGRDDLVAGWGVVGLPRTWPAALLADQTCEVGRLVIRSECSGRVQLVEEPAEEGSQLPTLESSALRRQLAIGSYVISYRRGPLRIQVDYDGRPTIGYDAPRRLAVALSNTVGRSLEVRVRLSAPAGFVVTTTSDSILLSEGETVSFMLTCSAPKEHARIAIANPCTLFLSVDDGSEVTIPITLLGEALWYAAGPYGSFDEAHAPEQPGILAGSMPLGAEGWQLLSVPEPMTSILAALEGEQGTYYLGTDISAPRTRRARLRVGCNDGTKLWLNGQEVFSQHEHRPVSPLSADEFEAELREGWNRLVIKMAQCSPRRFLSLAIKDGQGQMLIEAVNTTPRVPWTPAEAGDTALEEGA